MAQSNGEGQPVDFSSFFIGDYGGFQHAANRGLWWFYRHFYRGLWWSRMVGMMVLSMVYSDVYRFD